MNDELHCFLICPFFSSPPWRFLVDQTLYGTTIPSQTVYFLIISKAGVTLFPFLSGLVGGVSQQEPMRL